MRFPITEIAGAKEDSSFRVTGIFRDEAGVPMAVADLSTVKMWLYDHLGGVINSRSGVDIKNMGPGVIDSFGNLTLTLDPADSPAVPDTEVVVRRLLIIEWTWNGGAKKSHESIALVLKQEEKIPTS